MLIALDYDNTYTRDPIFWDGMISLAKSRGHEVVVATMRSQAEGLQVEGALSSKVDCIIFTNRMAKKPYLERLGYFPSVWIDDCPFFILNNAKQ